ncbi:MAG: YegP family protein [Acidobacteriota bacterium]
MSDVKHPKFVLKTGKNGKIYWHLTAKNGQAILSSQGYAAKSGAKNGIESVRTNSQHDERFERKNAADGQLYFVLKAANSQVIGNSEMYKTSASCEKGIASVRTNAPGAGVEDTTAG